MFSFFNERKALKPKAVCAITGNPAKYFDPLTEEYYSSMESFKILRERHYQKEEDSLLFRIQTLSDLASLKKERLKKIVLSHEQTASEGGIIEAASKYGLLKSENYEFERRPGPPRNYSRKKETCVETGMIEEITSEIIVINKRFLKFKDHLLI